MNMTFECPELIPEEYGVSFDISVDTQRRTAFLAEVLRPLTHNLLRDPRLHSFYFTRLTRDLGKVFLRVLGKDEEWHREAALRIIENLKPWREGGMISEVITGPYMRETSRYGGDTGIAIAEMIFQHDSILCLKWFDMWAKHPDLFHPGFLHVMLCDMTLERLGMSFDERLSLFNDVDPKLAGDTVFSNAVEASIEPLGEFLRPYFEEGSDACAVWKDPQSAKSLSVFLERAIPLMRGALDLQASGVIPIDRMLLLAKYNHARGIRLYLPAEVEFALIATFGKVMEKYGTGPGRAV